MDKKDAFCPALAEATVIKLGRVTSPSRRTTSADHWTTRQVATSFLATGHYRNGVLLAIATAQIIRRVDCIILNCRFDADKSICRT